MKLIFFLLLFCVPLPPAFAQGGSFSNLLRSVTGAISAPDQPAQKGQTTVLGVRGMDEGEAKSSAPVADNMKLLESWAVGRKEADVAAARRGLKARTVEYENSKASITTPPGTQ